MHDPYAGQGGSYMQDPKTGKRTRIEAPTQPPAEDASLLGDVVAIDAAQAKQTKAPKGE